MSRLTVDIVLPILEKLYPNAGCTLDHTNAFELLIATILSAQCTDKRVNIVTKALFAKYQTPQDYIAVSQEELEQDIFQCGTYRMKAKAIQATCQTLIDHFDSQVPRTMKDMLTLRGVGRKTASVVLGDAYGIHEGIAVDTHVTRVAKRLGLTRFTEQSKIEKDLMRQTPRKDWSKISHLLIAHGRALCTARKSPCTDCLDAYLPAAKRSSHSAKNKRA
ncbi:MAG: endonuclease III [Candidatus Peribacteraceae bacterium]|nr:endonuclease III [Candidatus Peribacteraceae bacterium]